MSFIVKDLIIFALERWPTDCGSQSVGLEVWWFEICSRSKSLAFDLATKRKIGLQFFVLKCAEIIDWKRNCLKALPRYSSAEKSMRFESNENDILQNHLKIMNITCWWSYVNVTFKEVDVNIPTVSWFS